MAVLKCEATSKQTGNRCRQPAIRGGRVCRFHGGGAPQVRAAAKDRLAALADRSIDAVLARVIGAAESGEDVGYLAVRVAHDLLDRAGLKAPSKVEADTGPTLEQVLGRVEEHINEECRLLHGSKCVNRTQHSRRMEALEEECIAGCAGACETVEAHIEKMRGLGPWSEPPEIGSEHRPKLARMHLEQRWKNNRAATSTPAVAGLLEAPAGERQSTPAPALPDIDGDAYVL